MQPITINLPAASHSLISGTGCVSVHATRETTGAAGAVYRIWDSDSASGTLLLTVSLAANE